MDHRRLSFWVLASYFLVHLLACGFDVAVPAGIVVDCVDNSECPEGYRCRAAIGRCISIEEIEDVEPVVPQGPVVEPALAGKGTRVTARFSVSHALFRDPLVYIEAPGGRVDFVVAEEETVRESLLYVYEHQADGSEPEETLTLQAYLVDIWGNEAKDVRLGAVTFDFTPPRLDSVTVTPRMARPGETIIVRAFSSEAIREGAMLRVDGPDGEEEAELLGSDRGVVTFGVALSADATDGARTLALSGIMDLAGNAAQGEPLDLGEFAVDGTPPVVMNLATDSERYSRVDGYDVIAIEFEMDEEPHDLLVTVGGQESSCVTEAGAAGLRSYTCTYRVSEVDREGLQAIRVWTVDSLGNVGGADVPVYFDFTPPALVQGSAELQLTPPPGCPITKVTRWGEGGGARVVFVLDEPVGEQPKVRTSAPEEIHFDHISGVVNSFAFEISLPARPLPQGAYEIEAIVVDSVGNAAEIVLDTALPLIVDTAAPTMLVNQEVVSYVRSPWGNAAPETIGAHTIPAGPYFALAPNDPLSGESSLPGGAFALDKGPPRLLQVWSDKGRGMLLGMMSPSENGSWARLRLANVDTPSVHVSAVDEACNVTETVKLENAEWVATPNPPFYGSSPNLLQAIGRSANVLVPAPETTRETGSEAWGSDGDAAIGLSSPLWLERGIGENPPARSSHAMAYDSARGRILLFGGNGASGQLQDTWEWDGNRWTNMTPASGNPPGRDRHAMAYDPVRGRIVLFGGWSAGGRLQDTWEWDGRSWTNMTPDAGNPPARLGHAMAYDAVKGRTVLFGGGSNIRLQDTWEWDGRSWTNVTPATANLPARFGHSMAYDTQNGRVVLFGGNDGGEYFEDTWEWDGYVWTDVTPVSESPPQRTFAAMVYDFERSRAVLFGGSLGMSQRQDTWEWDGQSWTNVTPDTGGPTARGFHGLAYDAESGRAVLFGGSGATRLSDTWGWDGSEWTDMTPGAEDPPARSSHAMAHDLARGRTVLFGGYDVDSGRLQDTWEWDGQSWTNVTPATPNPSARNGHAMAYDAGLGVILLFGGFDANGRLQDTWEWDGQGWTDVTPTSGNPPPRQNHELVFDAARERLVMFGGSDFGRFADTWEWDGSDWLDVTPVTVSPPARSNHAMAYDTSRGRTVLFGGHSGSGVLQDTWEWDGQSWIEATPDAGNPPARSDHAMVFDAARERSVLFGGWASGVSLRQDTWEWDGNQWVEANAPIGIGRSYHAMAHDAVRGRTVLFGGTRTGGIVQGDTWEFDSGVASTPSVQFAGGFAREGFDPEGVHGLRVRAHCGGAFAPYEVSDIGATLLVWASGGPGLPLGSWQPLAANAAFACETAPHLPAPPAALLDWSTDSVEEARRYIVDRTLSFQCRPSGLAGSGNATVALDYIEVRVRYRNP